MLLLPTCHLILLNNWLIKNQKGYYSGTDSWIDLKAGGKENLKSTLVGVEVVSGWVHGSVDPLILVPSQISTKVELESELGNDIQI